jgi:hypothetical protein
MSKLSLPSRRLWSWCTQKTPQRKGTRRRKGMRPKNGAVHKESHRGQFSHSMWPSEDECQPEDRELGHPLALTEDQKGNPSSQICYLLIMLDRVGCSHPGAGLGKGAAGADLWELRKMRGLHKVMTRDPMTALKLPISQGHFYLVNKHLGIQINKCLWPLLPGFINW